MRNMIVVLLGLALAAVAHAQEPKKVRIKGECHNLIISAVYDFEAIIPYARLVALAPAASAAAKESGIGFLVYIPGLRGGSFAVSPQEVEAILQK